MSLDAVKFHLENIRERLDLESRAAIRQWRGMPRQKATRREAMATETTVKLGHIGQVALTVKEIEPAVAFYRDVLGMTHLFTAGQLAFFDCAGTRLLLDALPEAQGNGNSVLYFTVTDIHGSQQALEAKGVKFEGAPHMIFRHPDGTEEWMTFFRDLEGNMLSLMEAVKP